MLIEPCGRADLPQLFELYRRTMRFPPHEQLPQYPFGSFDSFSDATERMLVELGFSAVCANVAGHNTVPRDATRLKRLRVSWIDDSKAELAKQCAGAYNWYALLQRVQALRGRT